MSMRDSFHVMRTGRPPKKADEQSDKVGMSFKVDPRLTLTELLLTMTLKEAGIESLDDFGTKE